MQETYGEDPFLTGEMATYFIKGLQGSDPRYVRVNSGCKHFDAHGGPEADRISFANNVSKKK